LGGSVNSRYKAVILRQVINGDTAGERLSSHQPTITKGVVFTHRPGNDFLVTITGMSSAKMASF
jgi:hypothetical protein